MGLIKTGKMGVDGKRGASYPSNYLHYRFANSENQNLLTSYYAKKDSIIFDSQLRNFKDRVTKKIASSGSSDEAAAIVEAMFSEEGQETMRQVLSPTTSPKTLSAAASSGIGDLSFGQVRARKVFLEQGRDLVNDVSNFQQGLEALLQEIASGLGDRQYQDLVDAVLLEAAGGDKSAATGSKAKAKILAQIYDRNGQFLSADPSSGAKLSKSMKKLIALSYALSDADGGSVTSVRRVSESKVIQTMANKVTGWLNHAAGVMEEIAVAACMTEGQDKLNKAFGTANKSIKGTAGGTALVDVKIDPALEAAQKYAGISENTLRVQKEDVSLSITPGLAEFHMGFSVKKYTVKGKNKGVHISLNSQTPFLTALSYGGLIQNTAFMGAMMHAAASRPGKGKEGSSVSEGSIQKEWEAARNIASLSAFLHNLAGSGAAQDNVMFLILNRQIYSVPDLIKMVMRNPSLVSSSTAGLGRSGFMNLNTKRNIKGLTTRQNALERSNEVQKQIIGRWQDTKVNAGLKMSL